MEATQQAYKYNLACHNYKGMAFGLRDIARIYDTNNQKTVRKSITGKHTH